MKESPTLLICLLVAVVSGVSGQLRHQCLNQRNDNRDTMQCEDIESWITCLQNAINDNVLSLNAVLLKKWQEDLKYFTDRKMKECASEENCKSEVRQCAEEFQTLYEKEQYAEAIGKIQSVNSCLDKITCDQYGLVSRQRQVLSKALEDFTKGSLRPGMTDPLRHKCLSDLDKIRGSATECKDFDAWITCLQNAINDKVLSLNTINLKKWQDDLKYFTDRKVQECDSGNANPEEKCKSEVRQCAEEFQTLYEKELYVEAIGKIQSVNSCLDKITCDQYGLVSRQRQVLRKALEDFTNGSLRPGGIGPNLHACLGELNRNRGKTQCEDNDAWILCLQNAINDPNLAANQTNIWIWRKDLNYFRQRKMEEDRCPSLKAEGSCIDREMVLCIDGGFSSAEEQCQKTPVYLTCFQKLRTKCNAYSVRIRKQIKISKKVIRQCDQRCMDEIRGCVRDCQIVMDGTGRIDGMRDAFDEANRCLDRISCDRYGRVEQVKVDLRFAWENYNRQRVSDNNKCNKAAFDRCYEMAETKLENDWWSSECDPKSLEDVSKCVFDIYPHCQTREQRREVQNFVDYVESVCGFHHG